MDRPRMTALHVMDFVPTKQGSFERFLLDLARGGGPLAHVFLFAGQPCPWFTRELGHAASVIAVEGNPLLERFDDTLRAIETLRPRLVSTSFLPLFHPRMLRLAWHARPARLVFCDHTSWHVPARHGGKRLLARLRGALFGRLCWRIVSCSDYNRRRNVERSFLPAARCRVIANGVPPANPTPAAIAPQPPYFFFAGRLIRDKGLLTPLDAYRRARQQLGEAAPNLRIAGDGALRDELARRCALHGLEHSVELLGLRDDVPALMAGALATIIPSEYPEAFGLVVAEAMQAGTLVLASDAGAIPEIVGNAGLIFPRGQAEALAHLMVQVATAPARFQELPAAARERVRTCFPLDRMVAGYRSLFARAAGVPHARAG